MIMLGAVLKLARVYFVMPPGLLRLKTGRVSPCCALAFYIYQSTTDLRALCELDESDGNYL